MLSEQQKNEINKYTSAYNHADYRMGRARKAYAQANIFEIPWRNSYLDVSTGRGEMLEYAAEIGYSRAQGTEVVPELLLHDRVTYAEAWNLPFEDNEFEVVTLFDVIEHILIDDVAGVLSELNRVAEKCVFITANNMPSHSLGQELHVTRLPYDEWDHIFRQNFSGEIEWLPRRFDTISETWKIVK